MTVQLRPIVVLVQVTVLCVSFSYGFLFWSRPVKKCCLDLGGVCFPTTSPYNSMPIPDCFRPKFKMFNRQTTFIYSNGADATYASIPASFSPTKKTVFIAHGFNDKPLNGNQWMIKSTKNLLLMEDLNIFLMDWSSHGSYAVWKYGQAAANARVAGWGLHEFAKALFARGLNYLNTYCIGHSLGSHICGYAGQFLNNFKFGRITGLDPAGPKFEKLTADARLSSGDAYFVDVIHTNGGGNPILDYGSLVPMGHIDFYPNGGELQPGCLNKRRKRSGKKEKILQRKARGFIASFLSCSHGRVTDIFYESIIRTCHQATKKCISEKSLPTLCYSCGSSCPIMGYHAADNKTLKGIYYMTTSRYPAYCTV